MLKNKKYALCLATIGVFLLICVSLDPSFAHNLTISYWGLFFIAMAIASLFLDGHSKIEIGVMNSLPVILSLVYVVNGTVLLVEGNKNNNDQLLHWGVLFVGVGSIPFLNKIIYEWYVLKRKKEIK
jgi:hypothetical protein